MLIKNIGLEDILEIAKDYRDYFNQVEGDGWSLEFVERRFKQLVVRFDYFGMGIYLNDKIIGFAVGNLSQFDDGLVAHLNEIFICRDFQSKGYGSKLLIAFEDLARDKGAFRIQLEAADDDIHHRFYNDRHNFIDTRSNVIKGKAL
jgi:GNAT superfamily N-acetyltransferase